MPIASAGIYKWVDENGLVHYGECPPSECKSEEIQLAPEPSQESIRQTKERIRKIRNYEKKTSKDYKKPAQIESTKLTKQPAISSHDNSQCFEKLESSWNGKIKDTREEVVPLILDKSQVSDIRNILNQLKGRSNGAMVETRCLSPKGTPPIKTFHYDFDWEADWKEKNLFLIIQRTTGIENRAKYRRFFRFLLDQGLLRYTSGTSDIVIDINRPQFDVGILNVDSSKLTFYFRGGGHIRRTRVISLRSEKNEFVLSEHYYVQGELSEMRRWSVNR